MGQFPTTTLIAPYTAGVMARREGRAKEEATASVVDPDDPDAMHREGCFLLGWEDEDARSCPSWPYVTRETRRATLEDALRRVVEGYRMRNAPDHWWTERVYHADQSDRPVGLVKIVAGRISVSVRDDDDSWRVLTGEALEAITG